jgi:hypothetical protein
MVECHYPRVRLVYYTALLLLSIQILSETTCLRQTRSLMALRETRMRISAILFGSSTKALAGSAKDRGILHPEQKMS